MIKKNYIVICGKYRKFEKSKIYLLEKTLVLSIICSKCKNEGERIFVFACVRYFLKIWDTSGLKTYMRLHLKPIFTCISITRKPKLYVAMSHASLH